MTDWDAMLQGPTREQYIEWGYVCVFRYRTWRNGKEVWAEHWAPRLPLIDAPRGGISYNLPSGWANG